MVAGKPLLALFGSAYAAHSAEALRLMVLAVFPVTVRQHFVAIRRVQQHIVSTALVAAGAGVLELTLAALGAEVHGLVGLSLGWLLALCLEAVAMSSTVYRVVVPNGIATSVIRWRVSQQGNQGPSKGNDP